MDSDLERWKIYAMEDESEEEEPAQQKKQAEPAAENKSHRVKREKPEKAKTETEKKEKKKKEKATEIKAENAKKAENKMPETKSEKKRGKKPKKKKSPAKITVRILIFAAIIAALLYFINLPGLIAGNPWQSRVPDVTGVKYSEALRTLDKAQLHGIILGRTEEAEKAAGSVISQDTAAGETLYIGQTVGITVISAAEKTTEDASEKASGKTAVPDVVYMTEDEASKLLKNGGFSVRYKYAESRDTAKGIVTAQDVKEGAAADNGTEITITVSSGCRVTVPDVLGLTQTQVIKKLVDTGFAVNIEYVEGDGDSVIEQDRLEGESLDFGSVITVKIEKQENIRDKAAAYFRKAVDWFASEFSPEKSVVTSVPEVKEKEEKSVVRINCSFGNVVKVDDSIFYWEYNSNSFSKKTSAAQYDYLYGVVNKLIRYDITGKQTVILEANGCAELAAAKGRIFYQTPADGDDGAFTVCSCNFDGTDVRTHFKGTIEAVSDDLGYIVCRNGKRSEGFFVMNSETFEKTGNFPEETFLACKGESVFYQKKYETSEDQPCGRTLLMSADFDGSNEKTVHITEKGLYGDNKYQGRSAVIENVYVQGDYIYYTYGIRDGKSGAFQGGKIVKVGLDGTKAETFAASNGGLLGGNYTVSKSGRVSYSERFEGRYPNMNEPFCDDGRIGFYDQLSRSVSYKVVTDDYFGTTGLKLNEQTEKEKLTYGFVQRIDDKIYFILTKSVVNSENDGGQQTFTREKSWFFEKNLKTGEVSLIYKF